MSFHLRGFCFVSMQLRPKNVDKAANTRKLPAQRPLEANGMPISRSLHGLITAEIILRHLVVSYFEFFSAVLCVSPRPLR
jgi:hypothetical protein